MNDTQHKSSHDPSMRFVCDCHAPKPGKYADQEPTQFKGKYVKKAFLAFGPNSGRETLEHMWVKVNDVVDGVLIGTLDNKPVLITEIQLGDEVKLTVDQIEDVYNG